MLEVTNLHVSYGHAAAVSGISLEVGPGEVACLIGPNGAGKTTALSAIFGLIGPSQGAVTFEGKSLIGLTPEQVVRRGLALVPEGRHIFTTLTVGENLALGATGVGRRPTESDYQQVFARFPILEHYRKAPAGGLSGGEQQQLAIARALLSKPRLLLLDEPSLGLAPLVVREVFDALAALRDQGVTIFLVEQNAGMAVPFANRTYVMVSGRIVLAGEREEMPDMEEIAAAYLGIESVP